MTAPRLSWVILTFNRHETVLKAFTHNLKNAGRKIDEIIWVDNGSDWKNYHFMAGFLSAADVQIRNNQNLGVSKGYNRGYAMATGTHICITGCDRLMPDGWAKTFMDYFEAIPETGVISCYSWGLDHVGERRRKGDKSEVEINGKKIIHAQPFEARTIRRDLFKKVGYLHEGFGLYGHEDIPWSERAMKCADEMGLIYYIIPGFQANHIGCEGIIEYNGRDDYDYYKFKMDEAKDPRKQQLVNELSAQGWPYTNPYA